MSTAGTSTVETVIAERKAGPTADAHSAEHQGDH